MRSGSKRLYVGETPVWECLDRLQATVDLTSVHRQIAIANEHHSSRWPVGLERAMLARGLPKLKLPPVELTSATGKAIRFKDSGSTDHLLERPPSELVAHKLWRVLGRDGLTADDILDLSTQR